ncbi:hypothetical protein RUND412_010600 [Rhizina undulata]
MVGRRTPPENIPLPGSPSRSRSDPRKKSPKASTTNSKKKVGSRYSSSHYVQNESFDEAPRRSNEPEEEEEAAALTEVEEDSEEDVGIYPWSANYPPLPDAEMPEDSEEDEGLFKVMPDGRVDIASAIPFRMQHVLKDTYFPDDPYPSTPCPGKRPTITPSFRSNRKNRGTGREFLLFLLVTALSAFSSIYLFCNCEEPPNSFARFLGNVAALGTVFSHGLRNLSIRLSDKAPLPLSLLAYQQAARVEAIVNVSTTATIDLANIFRFKESFEPFAFEDEYRERFRILTQPLTHEVRHAMVTYGATISEAVEEAERFVMGFRFLENMIADLTGSTWTQLRRVHHEYTVFGEYIAQQLPDELRREIPALPTNWKFGTRGKLGSAWLIKTEFQRLRTRSARLLESLHPQIWLAAYKTHDTVSHLDALFGGDFDELLQLIRVAFEKQELQLMELAKVLLQVFWEMKLGEAPGIWDAPENGAEVETDDVKLRLQTLWMALERDRKWGNFVGIRPEVEEELGVVVRDEESGVVVEESPWSVMAGRTGLRKAVVE